MGDNDGGKVYDSIGLIFRNDDKVEQFIGYTTKASPTRTASFSDSEGIPRV